MKALIIVLYFLLMVAALNFGLNRSEASECRTWAQYAQDNSSFYLTHWQSAQCARHEIPVPAPIRF